MTDMVDLAQEREAELRAAALAAQAERSQPGQPLPWPRDCLLCGDAIPLERAKARPDAILCIDCQTDIEG